MLIKIIVYSTIKWIEKIFSGSKTRVIEVRGKVVRVLALRYKGKSYRGSSSSRLEI